MATAPADRVIDCLISDFGGNYVFALDLLEQYRLDPTSVETSWRAYFDALAKVVPGPTVAASEPPTSSASQAPAIAELEPGPEAGTVTASTPDATGDDYARRIAEAFATEARYQALVASSRELVETTHNWDAWARRLGELLSGVVAG